MHHMPMKVDLDIEHTGIELDDTLYSIQLVKIQLVVHHTAPPPHAISLGKADKNRTIYFICNIWGVGSVLQHLPGEPH